MGHFTPVYSAPIHRSAMPYTTPPARGTERGRSHPVPSEVDNAGGKGTHHGVQAPIQVDGSEATNKGKKEYFNTNVPRAYLREPKHERSHATQPQTYAPSFTMTVHELKQMAKSMGLPASHFSDTVVVNAYRNGL